MVNAVDTRTEEVFEGKRVAIHVAPEGISLSMGGQAPADESQRLAPYDQVEAVTIREAASWCSGRRCFVAARRLRARPWVRRPT